MRERRWMMLSVMALGACLRSGCLSPQGPQPTRKAAARAQTYPVVEAAKSEQPESNYLVSRLPTVQLDVQTIPPAEKAVDTAEKPADKNNDKFAEPVEMRIGSEESSAPLPPADSPDSPAEVHPAPVARPDAPSVQALRALREGGSDEEINEQLKRYDPLTQEAMRVLLGRVAQLEQAGGISKLSPQELAAWIDPLNALTGSLRGRAQLILGRMCFCSCIKNFGEFAPLPPEDAYYQPGEVAHVYVEVRNFSSRRQQDHYLTVLKGRLEIYDENNRVPPVTWVSRPRVDVTATPRQDYYINFRFEVPKNCPAGLHTVRIAIEDWTDAAEGTIKVPKSRIAQRTLDFRVGGPRARSSRPRIAEVNPAP